MERAEWIESRTVKWAASCIPPGEETNPRFHRERIMGREEESRRILSKDILNFKDLVLIPRNFAP